MRKNFVYTLLLIAFSLSAGCAGAADNMAPEKQASAEAAQQDTQGVRLLLNEGLADGWKVGEISYADAPLDWSKSKRRRARLTLMPEGILAATHKLCPHRVSVAVRSDGKRQDCIITDGQ